MNGRITSIWIDGQHIPMGDKFDDSEGIFYNKGAISNCEIITWAPDDPYRSIIQSIANRYAQDAVIIND